MGLEWMPTGRISRAVTPTKLILGGGDGGRDRQGPGAPGRDTADMAADLASDPRLVRTAERLARELGEMKGAATKLGQILP